MLKLGSQEISVLYLGGEKINKAYLGSAVVFETVRIYTVTAAIAPAGSGAVTGAGKYREGDTAALRAEPADGYKFTGWQENGQTVSTDTEYRFTVTKNRNFTAAFDEIPSRLPDGYTELEYIKSSGTQYIRTNISPAASYKISMDIMPLGDVSGRYFFSSYFFETTSSQYRFSMYFSGTSINARLGKGSSAVTIVSESTVSKKITAGVDAATRTGFVDNTTKSVGNSSLYSNMPGFVLLSYNGSSSHNLSANLYSCQIYNGSLLVADYVPCKNPSNVVGLYDVVSGSFYPSAGSAAFTPGPAV